MGWGVYIPAEDEKLYEHFWDLCHYGLYTMETSLAYLKENCPEFYAIFYAKIEALLMTEEDLILQRTKEHSDKYERNFTKEDGYFYTLDGAKAAVPEGWRIPSDEDWKKLEAALGMASDLDVMNAWRGINAGDYLKVGGEAQFNAIYTGCNAWVYEKDDSNYWVNHDYSAYFWCSDETTRVETETSKEGETDEDGNLKEEESVVIREGIVRQLAIYSPKIWRGVTRLDNNVCYSVRCVKDVN